MIAITMGGDGALLVTAENHLFLKAPEVEVKSASGGRQLRGRHGLWPCLGPHSGRCLPSRRRFGTASVTSPGTQLCQKADVDRILEQIGAHQHNW